MLGVHPAVAARMIATVTGVSKGRTGVNIVTGWNKPEYSQMGLCKHFLEGLRAPVERTWRAWPSR